MCLCTCMCVSICIRVFMFVSVCMHMCVHICVYVFVGVYVYMYIKYEGLFIKMRENILEIIVKNSSIICTTFEISHMKYSNRLKCAKSCPGWHELMCGNTDG